MANYTITLNYNNNNPCQQTGSDGQTGPVITVSSSDTIIYQSATAVSQFQVGFSGGCPFASCPVSSPSGAPVNAGQPTASAVGNTYYYSSVSLGSNQCNNPGSMGLRIQP